MTRVPLSVWYGFTHILIHKYLHLSIYQWLYQLLKCCTRCFIWSETSVGSTWICMFRHVAGPILPNYSQLPKNNWSVRVTAKFRVDQFKFSGQTNHIVVTLYYVIHSVVMLCRAFLACSTGCLANTAQAIGKGTSHRKQNKTSRLSGWRSLYYMSSHRQKFQVCRC